MINIRTYVRRESCTHALRPPATLLGFLLSEPVSTSPPLNSSLRTSFECCLDSSEVSDTMLGMSKGTKKKKTDLGC